MQKTQRKDTEWLVTHVRVAERVAALALAVASLAVLGHAACLGGVSPRDVREAAAWAIKGLFGS